MPGEGEPYRMHLRVLRARLPRMTAPSTRTDDAQRGSSPLQREFAATVIVWVTVGLVAAALRMLARRAVGGAPTIADAFMDVWMIGLWATATPFILRSARRFPVRSPRPVVHAIVHGAMEDVFVVATNMLIRLPLLHIGLSALVTSAMLGVATYYPTAIISYGVIVAIGRRLFVSTGADATPSSPDSGESDEARLVIREWNRVHLIALDDIEWIEAANNHVVVHAAARTYKGRERISDVEARLDERRFVRVHRSAIVHLEKIREVQPLARGDHAIVLKSGCVVRVARTRKQILESALGVAL